MFFTIWKKFNAILFIAVILISGAYAASMFWLQVNSSYQDRIFQTIVDRTVTDSMTDIEKIKSLVEITHRLMGPPRKTFLAPPEEVRGFKDKQLHSADVALLGGYACYMHSLVAGMLLQKAGFEFRLFSMLKEGKSHHVGQVLYKGKYIAIDPLFNQMFVTPDGDYASVEEVHENWPYYKQQVGNKLLFKEYDKPSYYPTDFYREYYDYTPAPRNGIWSKPPKRTLTTMVLGFRDNYSLGTQVQLNRYLFWQIKLTKIYIWVFFVYIISIAVYYVCSKKFLNVSKSSTP
ncbi:MAG: hypothetical protein GWP10_21950 [Nitrospiraceae bacterium]|nr:hypothetical protein [Nitrospiraceae bacterium]